MYDSGVDVLLWELGQKIDFKANRNSTRLLGLANRRPLLQLEAGRFVEPHRRPLPYILKDYLFFGAIAAFDIIKIVRIRNQTPSLCWLNDHAVPRIYTHTSSANSA